MLIARYGDAGIGCGVIEIVFHGDVSFNECFGELTFRSSGQGVGAHARASATAEALLIEPSQLIVTDSDSGSSVTAFTLSLSQEALSRAIRDVDASGSADILRAVKKQLGLLVNS